MRSVSTCFFSYEFRRNSFNLFICRAKRTYLNNKLNASCDNMKRRHELIVWRASRKNIEVPLNLFQFLTWPCARKAWPTLKCTKRKPFNRHQENIYSEAINKFLSQFFGSDPPSNGCYTKLFCVYSINHFDRDIQLSRKNLGVTYFAKKENKLQYLLQLCNRIYYIFLLILINLKNQPRATNAE